MFKNKKIVAVVIAIIIVLAVAAFFFVGSTEPENNNSEEVEEEQVENTTAEFNGSYLYQAGENGEQSFRDASTEVTEYNIGDFLGVSSSYSAEDSAVIQFHVLDEEEEVIQQNAIEFRANEGEEKSLDACCEEVPSTPGSYYIGADADGEEIDFLIPFEVVESEE